MAVGDTDERAAQSSRIGSGRKKQQRWRNKGSGLDEQLLTSGRCGVRRWRIPHPSRATRASGRQSHWRWGKTGAERDGVQIIIHDRSHEPFCVPAAGVQLLYSVQHINTEVCCPIATGGCFCSGTGQHACGKQCCAQPSWLDSPSICGICQPDWPLPLGRTFIPFASTRYSSSTQHKASVDRQRSIILMV